MRFLAMGITTSTPANSVLQFARLPAIVAVCLAIFASPAWAKDCSPAKHQPVPKVIGKAYPAAREKLMAAGWIPYFNREMMDTTENQRAIAEQWIYETGFYEVDGCSGSGMGYCRMEFVDGNRAWLRIITEDGEAGDHTVSSTFFVCGPDE